MKVAEPTNERRVSIADAALQLLAEHGARGLTHRAVDARLELADGSTSYYFRTRAALLLAAAERLLALDLQDVATVSEDVAGTAALVERWLLPDARMRSLARMELLLAAARDPALELMSRAREGFIARIVRAQPRESAAEARIAATALVAMVDGLVLHGLVTSPLGKNDARRILERLRAVPARASRKGARRRHSAI